MNRGVLSGSAENRGRDIRYHVFRPGLPAPRLQTMTAFGFSFNGSDGRHTKYSCRFPPPPRRPRAGARPGRVPACGHGHDARLRTDRVRCQQARAIPAFPRAPLRPVRLATIEARNCGSRATRQPSFRRCGAFACYVTTSRQFIGTGPERPHRWNVRTDTGGSLPDSPGIAVTRLRRMFAETAWRREDAGKPQDMRPVHFFPRHDATRRT